MNYENYFDMKTDDNSEIESLTHLDTYSTKFQRKKLPPVAQQATINETSPIIIEDKTYKRANFKCWIITGVLILQAVVILAILTPQNIAQSPSQFIDTERNTSNGSNGSNVTLKSDNLKKASHSNPLDVNQGNEPIKLKLINSSLAKNDNKTVNTTSIKREILIIQPDKHQAKQKSLHFNIWDYSPQWKANMFKRYKERLDRKRKFEDLDFKSIILGKDEQFKNYSQSYESNSEIIDWNSLALSSQQLTQISHKFKTAQEKRREELGRLVKRYRTQYLGKKGFIKDIKQVSYENFIAGLEYQLLTGEKFQEKPQLKTIYDREKAYYQDKYNTIAMKEEIRACVVAPTFNNIVDNRYAWHIESLLQQDYSNYRIIIIDDASTDQTGKSIARHLKWRKADPEKVILIKNKNRRTATENFYYAVHKYCDYNQIFYSVDGDDELVGTQVFRLYNAVYQQNKFYTVYSNYFSYDSKNTTQPIVLGLSESYPQSVKLKATYRNAYHAYSHLRTMITDLFLLIDDDSLKDLSGKFYWTIADNAIYFPALELSCGRVSYIPQLEYWYTANTGMNDWRTPKQNEYLHTKSHIANYQKHYDCIDNIFGTMLEDLREEGP